MSIELGELSNGVALTQVTTDAHEKSNIYCELPYCSADSRVFVYEQKNSDTAPNTTEYIACEFGTWNTEVIGRGLGGPGMTHGGIFFYRRIVPNKCQELVRIDLRTGKQRVIYEFPEDLQTRGWAPYRPMNAITLMASPSAITPKCLALNSSISKREREKSSTPTPTSATHTRNLNPQKANKLWFNTTGAANLNPMAPASNSSATKAPPNTSSIFPTAKSRAFRSAYPIHRASPGTKPGSQARMKSSYPSARKVSTHPTRATSSKYRQTNPQSASARRAIASITSVPPRVANTSSATTGGAPANSSSAISKPAKPRSYAKREHPWAPRKTHTGIPISRPTSNGWSSTPTARAIPKSTSHPCRLISSLN